MHELSIAARVVEQAAERCRAEGGHRVAAVTLRIGRLACVGTDALRFAFEHLRAGTPLDGAALRIVEVPVRIWCRACAAEAELPGIQSLACPACGTPAGDLRAGRELDLDSIEILDAEPATP
ncbi:MAG: hydrogenase maturation nickel metallochaperone HypA [Planctomycetaceae bacterium]